MKRAASVFFALVVAPFFFARADIVIYRGQIAETLVGEGGTASTISPAYLLLRRSGPAKALIRTTAGETPTYQVEMIESAISATPAGPDGANSLVIAMGDRAGTADSFTLDGFYLRGAIEAVSVGRFQFNAARTLAGIGRQVRGLTGGEAQLSQGRLSFSMEMTLTGKALRQQRSFDESLQLVREALEAEGYTAAP